MAKDPKMLAERIITAARQHSGAKGGVRSPLYDLLWDQHETLAPHLNPPLSPNWEKVAEEMAASGVLDGKGQPPKAVTTQKTWAKVVRDKLRAAEGAIPARRTRRKSTAEPAAPQPAPSPSSPSPPASDPAGGENPYGFRVAGGVKNPTRKDKE